MERFVDRWEYLTTVLEADATADGAERYLLERYPGRDYPKFALESLTPALNRLGKDGWELLSLQPVFLGKNGDVNGAFRPAARTRQLLHASVPVRLQAALVMSPATLNPWPRLEAPFGFRA